MALDPEAFCGAESFAAHADSLLTWVKSARLAPGVSVSGMILSAKALLDHNPEPSEAEVRSGLADLFDLAEDVPRGFPPGDQATDGVPRP